MRETTARSTPGGRRARPLQVGIVADEEHAWVSVVLQERGYTTSLYHELEAAETLLDDPPQLLIVTADVEQLGDGLEFVARARNTRSHDRLPIIVLSALEEDDLLRGYASGASDCLSLETATAVLLAKCKRSLEVAQARALEPDPAASEPGLMFDRYLVDGYLGEGSFGVVYAALDLRTGRRVALKVLSQAVADPENRQRFLRETYSLTTAAGPHLVGISDSGAAGDELYFAMEQIDGPTLSQRVRDRGPLTESEALTLLRALCLALDCLHQSGLIHRDIKPANIILRDGDCADPVLVDFGLCKRPFDRAVTTAGMMMGTPGYMAPELLETNEIDARSDLFALGITMIFACSGREPFERFHGLRLLKMMATTPAPIPSTVPSSLGPALRGLTLLDPDERPQSVEDLLSLLDARALTPPRRLG